MYQHEPLPNWALILVTLGMTELLKMGRMQKIEKLKTMNTVHIFTKAGKSHWKFFDYFHIEYVIYEQGVYYANCIENIKQYTIFNWQP